MASDTHCSPAAMKQAGTVTLFHPPCAEAGLEISGYISRAIECSASLCSVPPEPRWNSSKPQSLSSTSRRKASSASQRAAGLPRTISTKRPLQLASSYGARNQFDRTVHHSRRLRRAKTQEWAAEEFHGRVRHSMEFALRTFGPKSQARRSLRFDRHGENLCGLQRADRHIIRLGAFTDGALKWLRRS